MKARANSSKTFTDFLHFNTNSHFPCDRHPFHTSPAGICPHCLNDRLLQLVCSDCGERRASACSCCQTLFHRNSCSNADVGSFGRISFLIDSDKIDRGPLRRSSSNSAWVKKSGGGFSRIKGLFVKRRRRRRRNDDENLEFCDENCGFRDVWDDEDGDRFCNRSVFPVKERDLSEAEFIELKVDSSCELFSAGRSSRASDHGGGCRNEDFEILASLRRSGVSGKGGSCRITINERGCKQGNRTSKLWKWIFKNHHEK